MFIQTTKARLFKDGYSLKRIMAAQSPGEAKAVGAKVKNFIQDTWANAAMETAINYHQAKFTQNPSMTRCLLVTGEIQLLESSPSDNPWGIGVSMFDPMIMNEMAQWGDNIPVKALMEIQKSIRESSSTTQNMSNHSSSESQLLNKPVTLQSPPPSQGICTDMKQI